MFCDVKFSARSQIRRDYFHPTIFLHGDIFFLWATLMSYALPIFLTYFWARSLRSRCLLRLRPCDCSVCVRPQIRRDYFHPTIFWHGDIFFCVCDPNTGTFENWLSTVKALRPHSARYARFVPPAFGRWRGLRWDKNLHWVQ